MTKLSFLLIVGKFKRNLKNTHLGNKKQQSSTQKLAAVAFGGNTALLLLPT